MSCVMEAVVHIPTDPFGRLYAQGNNPRTYQARCKTHGWLFPMGHGFPLKTDAPPGCPLGQIEAARDAAIIAIQAARDATP